MFYANKSKQVDRVEQWKIGVYVLLSNNRWMSVELKSVYPHQGQGKCLTSRLLPQLLIVSLLVACHFHLVEPCARLEMPDPGIGTNRESHPLLKSFQGREVC